MTEQINPELNKTKVEYQDLIDMITSETFTLLPNGRTTICQLTLKNGFSVEGQSACVSKENYQQSLGEKYSREEAIEKLWPFAGFALAERLYQDKQSKGDTYISRMRTEINELVERISKLEAFLSKLPEGFDEVAEDMLRKQLVIMKDLEHILALRFNHAVCQ